MAGHSTPLAMKLRKYGYWTVNRTGLNPSKRGLPSPENSRAKCARFPGASRHQRRTNQRRSTQPKDALAQTYCLAETEAFTNSFGTTFLSNHLQAGPAGARSRPGARTRL